MFSLPRIHRLGTAAIALVSLSAAACAPEALAPYDAPVANPGAGAVLEQPVTETAPSVTSAPSAPASPTATPSPALSSSPAPTVAPPVTEEVPGLPVATAPAPDPVGPPMVSAGSQGELVRELQHRLLQINWLSGQITGEYADATALAVEGFQTKRGLPATGEVDDATWEALVGMTRPPTHDEMHNILKPGPALLAPGSSGDAVKDLQARLKQLNWFFDDVDGIFGPKTAAAVEGFQGKREIPQTGEVDQRTLDRLHSMSRTPSSDELNNITPAPAPEPEGIVLDDRCLQGRVICISKSQRELAWVVDGQILMTMDVRFGSELTPTREGTFSVGWKSRHHVSSLYDSKMPYALFFSGGQAIHYSSDFAARGYNGSSHGCVNVRDEAAVAALFEAASEGDKVVVYA